jgi:hypothetical protein
MRYFVGRVFCLLKVSDLLCAIHRELPVSALQINANSRISSNSTALNRELVFHRRILLIHEHA